MYTLIITLFAKKVKYYSNLLEFKKICNIIKRKGVYNERIKTRVN